MTLAPAFLDELRARTSLSGLIARTVKLTKCGREFKACCPFHQEKTGSFYVNDDKSFYHCFGCSAHGDAIAWLTDQGGLTFMDAVKELADAAGMEVPRSDPRAQEQADQRAPLFEACDRAAGLFASHRDARAPGAYLEQRAIDPALAAMFQIGFAPDARDFLATNLHGVSRKAAIEAGLLVVPDDDRAPYDRFRGRLMFPIHDARGRCIGFGGRILGAGEPKYLNSPETPIFDKGRTLYNIHRAAPAARKANRLLVVEGYMDVIGLARVGILEVVAPNGTAVTETQLAMMWKQAPEPIFVMDGDRAGQAAMIKAAVRALPALEPDKSLRFVALPEKADPDDIARKGGRDAVEALLGASVGLADLLWRHEAASGRLDTPEGRAGLRQRLIEHTATIEHAAVRDQYREEFKRRFDEAFAAPERGSSARPRQNDRRKPGERWKPPERPVSESTKGVANAGVGDLVRLALLAGCLRFPDVVAQHYEELSRLKLQGRYAQLLDVLVDEAMTSGLTADSLPALLERHGMAGAPAALQGFKLLPFGFLAAVPGPDARADLVEAIYAETRQ